MNDFLRILDDNTQQIAKEIEARIIKRGENTDQLNELSDRFEIEKSQDNGQLSIEEIKTLLNKMEVMANIKVVRPLISYDEKYNSLKFWARKVIRKLISWYITPIVTEQNEFNNSMLDIIKQIERKIGEFENKE